MPYCCLKIRLKWVGFLSDKVHALYLIWLLAVVSLPCAIGYLHVCEDCGEGRFLGRAGIDAEADFIGSGIHVTDAHLVRKPRTSSRLLLKPQKTISFEQYLPSFMFVLEFGDKITKKFPVHSEVG